MGSCADARAWYGAGGAHGARAWHWHASAFDDPLIGSSGLGVRRPVRFLALRLDLDDKQVAQLSRIVERLRTEREQAAVDLRRAAGDLADALEASDLDAARVEAGTRERVAAAERVQQAVARALRELHALLDAEQREELAALIRSGALRL
jgi:Spy/CpxP family protein refolding chaperone